MKTLLLCALATTIHVFIVFYYIIMEYYNINLYLRSPIWSLTQCTAHISIWLVTCHVSSPLLLCVTERDCSSETKWRQQQVQKMQWITQWHDLLLWWQACPVYQLHRWKWNLTANVISLHWINGQLLNQLLIEFQSETQHSILSLFTAALHQTLHETAGIKLFYTHNFILQLSDRAHLPWCAES